MDNDTRLPYPRRTDQIGRTANTGLTKLWRAAVRLERLQTLLAAALPADVRPGQVRVASLRGPVLTLMVGSSAWSARLRFDVPLLLKRLSELSDFQGVQQIRLQVAGPQPPGPEQPKVDRRMSAAAAATLNDCATALPAGELREALLKLARHQNAP